MILPKANRKVGVQGHHRCCRMKLDGSAQGGTDTPVLLHSRTPDDTPQYRRIYARGKRHSQIPSIPVLQLVLPYSGSYCRTPDHTPTLWVTVLYSMSYSRTPGHTPVLRVILPLHSRNPQCHSDTSHCTPVVRQL